MDKVAIVTGASRGIGAATAIALSKNNYKVCVNFLRNSDAADAVCSIINEQGGVAISYQADVADEAQVEDMFNYVNTELGTVTHLVNNVGVLSTKSLFSEISVERFSQVLNTNVLSAFICSKAFVN